MRPSLLKISINSILTFHLYSFAHGYVQSFHCRIWSSDYALAVRTGKLLKESKVTLLRGKEDSR